MCRKLLTQDRILQWDFSRRKNMNMMCCLLCYENFESHSHLFFECKLSSHVWSIVRDKAGMHNVKDQWSDIVGWLSERANSKSTGDYVSRLIVAASAYVIWQERNMRLFKNQTRPPDTIASLILNMVRYKLLGVKFKSTVRVKRLLDDWGIHQGADADGIG
ncbi:uncharacterized protein LOC110880962 [Helianthus annuus]|uniref:uncharacterized protein LOC110880962 n=1 Tax=Helianthus annuus TaxID=4232 RepID=UPI000B8EF7E3|nr:uncharacterized protein LOC110880962 [Helianthus annuus]